MKSQPIRSSILLLVAFQLITSLLSAQKNQTLQMTGAKMRAPLDLPQGTTTIHLCDLAPGKTYTVIALGAAYDQKAKFEIAAPLSETGQEYLFLPDMKNVVRFSASSSCVDFQVIAHAFEPVTSIPASLSVLCENCPQTSSWKEQLSESVSLATLSVEGGQTAEELISNVLIDGDCFDVKNVTYSGENGQIGTFSNGQTNIGFESGIIMATGEISVATGPNDQGNASDGYANNTPDAELAVLTTGPLFDRASIEFDFTPTETPVTFQFVFASEEYCEYVFSQYNDVFGFFISGPGISGTKNLALIPGTSSPITINTLNHVVNDDYYVNNQPIFSGLCGQLPSFDPAVQEVQYDGFTVPLFAVADVIPCSTYHIKLKIADVGDGAFDSAVFLKGGSFDGGGDYTADFVVNGDPDAQESLEGCGAVALLFDRVGSDLSQPVTVSFAIGGSALPGVDYAPLDSVYIIPAGQDQLLVPVSIISDFLTEGVETLELSFDNSCSCETTQKTLTILDYTAMSAPAETLSICSGGSVTLTANVQGGVAPYTYLWSTNETTASVSANPSLTTTYTVAITDKCGAAATGSFLVEVKPLEQFAENISFCPGEAVDILGVIHTAPGVVEATLPGQGGDCDTIATYTLKYLTPAPSIVNLTCPGAYEIQGANPTTVTYDFPVASSDCLCPGIAVDLAEGLPSGSIFPEGITKVRYAAKDSCGNTASCFFNVKIANEQPCDVKTIACITYELLSITKDQATNRRTYRIRVTNDCANKMLYAAFQLPNGVTATDPLNNTVYTSPDGNEYDVRNPNFSPFYSIRFKPLSGGLAGGESDIFEFTLPAYAAPAHIHSVVRIYPKTFYEAYLNTYNCVESIQKPLDENLKSSAGFRIFPNPASGSVYADLSAWKGESLQMQLFDSRGQCLQNISVTADAAPRPLQLPEGLADGLYFIGVLTPTGERQTIRFVVKN